MKIVHLSTADLRHGAGIAAFRLHTALKKAGHTSSLLVAEKTSNDEDVISLEKGTPKSIRGIQNIIELGINTLGPQNTFSFFRKILEKHPLIDKTDIIHCHNLHWPFKNFPLSLLNRGKLIPLVWTFHDMWPITGHCFYALNCEKWQTGCRGGCPQLFSFIPVAWDSSPMQWNIKKRIYADTRFTVITPSQWLTGMARQSPLLTGHEALTIPNIADLAHFKPRDRNALKKAYGFSENEKLVMFIAGNINVPVKGLNYLLEALKNLNNINFPVTLLLVGNGEIPQKYLGPVKYRHLGRIKDHDKIAEIYNLSDLTVVPSTADNFPNTIAESMACGTPVIGSRVGGIPDMIEHKVNGYLCEPGNVQELTDGLKYFLLNDQARIEVGKRAQEKITSLCSEEHVVAEHLKVYEQQKLLTLRTKK